MSEHAQRVLEYDKIKGIVAGFAASASGRDAVLAQVPADSQQDAASLLEETGEFMDLLRRGEAPPLDGIRDLRPVLGRLQAGALCTPREFHDIAETLAAARRVAAFFGRQARSDAGRAASPRLTERAAGITPLPHLEEALHAAVDDRGEVRDSASPALRRIRKQINKVREEVLARLNQILHSSAQDIVQDAVITVRDDRYVIPLKPNFRQSLKGVVHGQSGSRATVFVEPLDVLEQNNRLAELRTEEHDEVDAILRRLSSLVMKDAPQVTGSFRVLTELDAVHARARYGIESGAMVPVISGEGRLRLRAARHPLLLWQARTDPGRTPVISNDIELGADQLILIISGPNAGGKTVILKTVGLMSLMAQSGIPVTAGEGSEMPLFRSIFADIGDEQSLEQDLSTFSSHVRQVAEIMEAASPDSLVLLDELGTGTDPAEGSALGAAVLDELITRRCRTIVTTHQGALKLFGSQTGGAMNAAMEFDPATLRPTYRLIAGRPGRSYGLDMAARLGVPLDVIKGARDRLTSEELRLEDLLERMEEDSRLLAEDRAMAERDRTTAAERRAEADRSLQEAREAAGETLRRARQEARQVIAALRDKLKELSRTHAPGPASIRDERAAVDALVGRLEPEIRASGADPGGPAPAAGDQVRIPRLNATGMVLASREGELEIEVNGKTLRMRSAEVARISSPAPRSAPRSLGWKAELTDDDAAADRLNLIGLHVPEALAAVDRAIDRASISGLGFLTIIHGIGTGVLKASVADFLKGHPLVAAHRPGGPAEGGAGVTIAELKK